MPRIFTVFGFQRHYLRAAPDGRIIFVTDRAEADNIRIETPYSADPLPSLKAAAAKNTSVILLFPGRAPLHPVTDGIVPGADLVASTDGDPLYRRWFIKFYEDYGYFEIDHAISSRFGIGAVRTSSPILSDSPRVFWDDASAAWSLVPDSRRRGEDEDDYDD